MESESAAALEALGLAVPTEEETADICGLETIMVYPPTIVLRKPRWMAVITSASQEEE